MTNAVIAYFEKELGILKADAAPIETSLLAWVHNFLADMTLVIKQAADDAVVAAVATPGTGEMKAAAAFAIASADLVSKGIPIADADLKTAIQISYKALPASVTSTPAAQAVVGAADAAVDSAAAKVESKA